jgi:hypothetical protein
MLAALWYKMENGKTVFRDTDVPKVIELVETEKGLFHAERWYLRFTEITITELLYYSFHSIFFIFFTKRDNSDIICVTCALCRMRHFRSKALAEPERFAQLDEEVQAVTLRRMFAVGGVVRAMDLLLGARSVMTQSSAVLRPFMRSLLEAGHLEEALRVEARSRARHGKKDPRLHAELAFNAWRFPALAAKLAALKPTEASIAGPLAVSLAKLGKGTEAAAVLAGAAAEAAQGKTPLRWQEAASLAIDAALGKEVAPARIAGLEKAAEATDNRLVDFAISVHADLAAKKN